MLFNYSLSFILFIYLFFVGFIMFFLGIYFNLFDVVYFVEYELFILNSNQFIMTMLFDWMSLLFMSFVLFISSLIIYYSEEYMSGDFFLNRFLIMILVFVFSMMFLIISPNLISILIGWDGLGLVSYCLVIYYQNIKSFNSGMITALSNRVGDSMLLMSIAWMFSYGGWNYFIYLDFFTINFDCQLIGWLIVIAAMTKSAQIPFSPWLPAAMAAPTPVSSLVHSSTLVTAGVYLLIRFNPLYLDSFLSNFLLFVALITMFMSGFCANFEYDLKKIVALSTLSQLGLMMGSLSLGFVYLTFFHLLTHALFKALLFMCSGNIIHCVKDNQDIRSLGNIFLMMPLTCVCFVISSMCLCGLPFLSGFYSKDLILEIYSMSYLNLFCYIIFYFSTGLTVSYSIRLVYYLMIKNYSFYSLHNIYESNWVMMKSMLCLLLIAILGGCMMSWILFPTPNYINIPLFLSILVLLVCITGGWLGYFISKFSLQDLMYSSLLIKVCGFFGNMWFMPYITVRFPYPMLISGVTINNIMDHGWFEFFGSQGLYAFLIYLSTYNHSVQNVFFNLFFVLVSFWFILLMFI
uniref:NADH-ubiquinone oxidoreductase chain 5 n=1 Tax=Megalophasma granulatum TaxID=2042296 RepID=A0A343KJT1_9NEOP|nr:NADH dehydrogenase subunit 5 [Megalophasma granulatum]